MGYKGGFTLIALLGCAASGCQGPVEFTGLEIVVPGTLPPGWYGPHSMDLGDVRDPTVAGFYKANAAAYSTTTAGSFLTSFLDFRLASGSTTGALTAGLFDGTNVRVLGRIYHPYSQGGTGWAGYGTQSAFIDSVATDYTQLASGFSPTGSLLSVFTDGLLAHTGQAVFGQSGSWNGFSPTLGAVLATAPAAAHGTSGYKSSVSWDSLGHAYYAYASSAGTTFLDRYSLSAGWDPAPVALPAVLPATAATVTQQTQVLNDGLGVTALWLSNAAGPTNATIKAAWSLDSNFTNITVLAPGDTKSMSAATDTQGDVVVVYLQQVVGYPSTPAGITAPPYPVRNNSVRVFASVRGATGTWFGPTQLDDPTVFNPYTTTVYQTSQGQVAPLIPVVGGVDYPTPAVAYVGSGRFLAAFPVIDLANSVTGIYARGYTVGTGWDAIGAMTTLDSLTIPSATAPEGYRMADHMTMTGDGQGNAMLVAQVVVPIGDGATEDQRNYATKVYQYSGALGSWPNSLLIPSSICRADATPLAAPLVLPYFCWGLKPQVTSYPGGETVVVYPAPAAQTGTLSGRLRLYSMEYR